MEKSVVKISSEELILCVMNNDVRKLGSILNSFAVKKNGTPIFLDDTRMLLNLLTLHASICAKNGTLSDEFAFELIERIASVVDIFSYLVAILHYANFHPQPDTTIPKPMIKELRKDEPSDLIYHFVHNMSRDQYLLLATYITGGDFKKVNIETAAALLLYAYEREIVSRDICLSYMANCFVGTDDAMRCSDFLEADLDEDGYCLLSILYDYLIEYEEK